MVCSSCDSQRRRPTTSRAKLPSTGRVSMGMRYLLQSPADIAALARSGLIEHGDDLAALVIDKALVGGDPIGAGALARVGLVVRAFEHDSTGEDEPGNAEPQGSADRAAGERRGERSGEQDDAKDQQKCAHSYY